jgi:hypothetical protein
MRIENLRFTKNHNRPGVAADILWEDCELPSQTLQFETDVAFAEDLTCNPHTFLVGALLPAMHFGEQRIYLNHDICPELYEGIVNAMHWIRRWFYRPNRKLPLIEIPISKKFPYTLKKERAGFFFSGGIDSYATFYGNRKRFGNEHPYAIQDGILVYGVELYDSVAFSYVHSQLSQAAEKLGITLIPVYTNLYLGFREEDSRNNFSFWINELMGATFAAIAHAFTKRLSVISIASNSDIANLGPLGSHPLLDNNYSSCDLKIRHDGAYRSRFEKTRLVTGNDVPLEFLRVCNLTKKYTPTSLNCGFCAKCIKTKLTLLALDVLDQTAAFENKEITPEIVKRSAFIYDAYTEATYMDLIDPLEARGHWKLAEAIRFCLRKYRNRNSVYKRELHRLDENFFDGFCGKMISHARKKISALS